MVIYNNSSEKIDDTSRIAFEILKAEHAERVFDSLNDDRIYKYIPLLRYDTKGKLEGRFIMLSSKGPNDGTCIWLNWVLKKRQLINILDGYKLQYMITEEPLLRM